MTSGTVRRPDPGSGGVSTKRRRFKNPFDPNTTAGRQRIVGAVIFVVLFGFFFSLNRFPKLDIVREDVAIATRDEVVESGTPREEISNCFQGFCFDDDQGLLERWWQFSVTYIDLVTVGMIFAFLVAGITDTFLFPTSAGPAFGKRGWRGALQGLTVGPLMTLCSACIVPVANSFKKRGAGIEATIAITQGSATLNAPAFVMLFVIFTPLLAASRVAISIVGALALGPAVAWLVNRGEKTEDVVPETDIGDLITVDPDAGPARPWFAVMLGGFRDWMVSSWRFFYRLAPIMVIAGFIGGFAIQFLTEDGVSALLGNHLLGIVLAATMGILINVPLLFEIPLVAGLMLLGMGVAPAATLLFTAAAAGPITFWGMAREIGRRAVGWLAVTTWALGVVGGIAVIGWTSAFPHGANTPTVVFDGSSCEYSGPSSIAAEPTVFRVINETEYLGTGLSLNVMLGRLPDGVTAADLADDVAALPVGELPPYFSIAGEETFVFPGSSRLATFVVHNPGTYGIVCTHGGGGYVVSEFSMPQPIGWFEEFRNTFAPYVSPDTLVVVP